MTAENNQHRKATDDKPLFRQALALIVCGLLLQTSLGLGETYPAPENVGAIIGVKPGATVANQPLDKAMPLERNAVLRTDRSGRLRLRLRGGEVLTLGSNTELQVPKSNPVAETAQVSIHSGELRSAVGHFRGREAAYDVVTPQAFITSHGDSDFYLQVDSTHTRVLVYSGIVLVRPMHGPSTAPVDVAAGQTVVVTPGLVSRLALTSEDQEQASMWQTSVPNDSLSEPAQPTRSHKKLYIIVGAAGAAVAGIALAAHGSRKSAPPAATTVPTSVPTIPAH
jgi:hypothetical protein